MNLASKIAIGIAVIVSGQALAKVPQLTLQATCDEAEQILVGKVGSTQKNDADGTSNQWIAHIDVTRSLKGSNSPTKRRVYYQPDSSVSATFHIGRTYVIFAIPYKDGLTTVNGEGGAFVVASDQIDDVVLRGATGPEPLERFLARIVRCVKKP